jgi:hypothetical protein
MAWAVIKPGAEDLLAREPAVVRRVGEHRRDREIAPRQRHRGHRGGHDLLSVSASNLGFRPVQLIFV